MGVLYCSFLKSDIGRGHFEIETLTRQERERDKEGQRERIFGIYLSSNLIKCRIAS